MTTFVILLVGVAFYSYSVSQEGPLFNAGVSHMFKALAVTIFEELQGKNVSLHGDLLTKIYFLNGGLKQLMATVEDKSPKVFESVKPIVQEILETGKPQFEKIKIDDSDLMQRFAWNSTQIAEFRDLHSDIDSMLKRLGKICKLHNFDI